METWVAISAFRGRLIVVSAEVTKGTPPHVVDDDTWPIEDGARPEAYHGLFDRLRAYLQSNKISRLIVKASVGSQQKATTAVLEGAEVRGVVLAAAAATPGVAVQAVQKQQISRIIGTRNVGEYASDTAWWTGNATGDLRIGSRETALMLIAVAANR